MAQTNKLSLVDEKLNELKSTIAATEISDAISKNTRSTKLYALRRERRVLHLVRSLIKANPDIKLDKDDADTFVLITTLASERTVQSSIVINEGDNILEVLQKYQDRKAASVTKAAEKAGLKMDYASGKFVKA